MPEKTENAAEKALADLSPKLKFAITIGTQLFVGILGIATTAAVTIYVANMSNNIIKNASE